MSVPWYSHEAPQLQPEFRELITNYANILPQDVEKHVQAVRDKAWRVAPFPCVGSYLFAELALSKLPAYPAILSRLKSDPSSVYLEAGCGLAQDVRKLIADGAPAAQLRGTDLQAGLMACGHDLFRDAEALPLGDVADAGKAFVAADFLDESDASPLRAWVGGADIVHASMFLHCFELPTQRLGIYDCRVVKGHYRAMPYAEAMVRREGRIERLAAEFRGRQGPNGVPWKVRVSSRWLCGAGGGENDEEILECSQVLIQQFTASTMKED
ncbi:hypothetical protein INS49_013477 [Diaporthe citri]|uniref:uncharacterized protein n=1 Tax=Diaporthe citri TaxID=83186 RepID=UPI001C810B6F|nr:uncharacterized protein INS49_013477 [Diaporthe citri]KAG6357600.1 hypothetical protein INS49_013477 [Diaporthe citri]